MDEKIDELSNEICMGAIDYTTQRDIKPHRNGVHGHIAQRLIEKGYRKESDTAREILTELVKRAEKISFFDCRMGLDLDELSEKYGVDLGEMRK